MTYQFIRVDKSLVVPATSIFGESDNGETVYITVPGFADSFPVGGEIAEAVKAFLTGSRTFPVTANGVLDIYSGWVDGLAAARALEGESAPINWPLRITEEQKERQIVNARGDSPVPVVDVEKITRAVRERK